MSLFEQGKHEEKRARGGGRGIELFADCGYGGKKTLGLLAFVSFVYRYARFIQNGLRMDLKWNVFDACTMGAHLALSCSALIFHVLPKRIINRPMIIWEEYRLHAIVFTLRSVAIYAHGVWRPLAGTAAEPLLLLVLVMGWHLIADEITRRFSDGNHTTVRIQVRCLFVCLIVIVLIVVCLCRTRTRSSQLWCCVFMHYISCWQLLLT